MVGFTMHVYEYHFMYRDTHTQIHATFMHGFQSKGNISVGELHNPGGGGRQAGATPHNICLFKLL